MKRFVVLHNLRSSYNVGAVFRTADGAGISKIYLTGHTPAPTDRFGRPNQKVIKTALGATEFIPWEQVIILDECLAKLRSEGVDIVVVEQHPRAIDYRQYSQTRDAAFVFGNEILGIPSVVCEHADAVLMIPMLGKKESLNVSVTAGVILFAMVQ